MSGEGKQSGDHEGDPVNLTGEGTESKTVGQTNQTGEKLDNSIINPASAPILASSNSTPSAVTHDDSYGQGSVLTSRLAHETPTFPQSQSIKRPQSSPLSPAKSSPPKRRRMQFTFNAGNDSAIAIQPIPPTNTIRSTPVSNGHQPRTSLSGDTTMVDSDNDTTTFKMPLPPTPQTSDFASVSTTLRPLPLPILLLIQAQIHQSSLVTPIIRPRQHSPPKSTASSTSSSTDLAAEIAYTEEWIEWMRKSGGIVAALRSVIAKSGDNAGVSGGRLDLRARCELAEILIREMEGTAEAEKVISKGVRISFDYLDSWPLADQIFLIMIDRGCEESELGYVNRKNSETDFLARDSMKHFQITNIDYTHFKPNFP
jgi:hypothetical protein